MEILSVNAGSSSLKFTLIELPFEKVVVSGTFEKIGIDGSFYTIKYNGEKIKKEVELKNHTDAVKILMNELIDMKILDSYDDLDGVGHRVLHGGDTYFDSIIITPEVEDKIEELFPLGPLHNPANLAGIRSFKEILPNTPQVAVFDTAFHQTMDAEEYLYAVPMEWYEKFSVRKYGFHGTSHKYIAQKMREILGEDKKIISCHLGNGASLCAIKDGKCVDTSMGLTPLEGLIMGTRSGDLDPAVLGFVMQKENININEMTTILNKKSGLLGISGKTGDIRDLKELEKQGDKMASLALDMFAYRVKKYIGSYMAVLGHVDAIIFEGGIGEHNPDVLSRCVSGLEELGIVFDNSHNDNEQYEGIISMPESKIKMYIIPTNEELEIAEETMELVK